MIVTGGIAAKKWLVKTNLMELSNLIRNKRTTSGSPKKLVKPDGKAMDNLFYCPILAQNACPSPVC
jgi:hypothetical protein